MSFTAQYRMVDAARHLPVVAALEAAIPDAAALVFACLGIALAVHGRRALRARALNLASVGRQRVHERDRGRAGLAEPGHLGHAAGRLRPGQRHPHHASSAPATSSRPPGGRRGGHPAGHPRRPGLVAAAPGPGPRLHPGRVPRLGARGVPGRPRPPRRPAPVPGRAEGTVPRKATKTARFLSLVTERHGPLAAIPLDRVAAISAALAPAADLNPGAARAALRKAVLSARNGDPSMIAKYAIALIVLIVLAAAFAWAFLPARYLPGNRARHLRIRLHLRLHPGKGFAHVFSL